MLGGATPTGSATVDVDTTSGAFSITGSYTGMTSNVNAVHLHGLAPVGVDSAVIFSLSFSGGMTGTFLGSSTLSAANLSGLLDGLTYIIVRTSNNPVGEIRGQVIVPEPSTLGLLGAGLIGLFMRRKRVV